MKSAHDLLSASIFIAILATYILAWYVVRSIRRSPKRLKPVAENELRAPGQSSKGKIEALDRDIKFNLMLVLTIPLVLLSGYVLHIYVFADSLNSPGSLIIGGVGAAVGLYYSANALKLIRRRRILRSGYQSAMTVGQALNQLALDGSHVYHDLPAGDFNIDHIVVGPAGIFAVESIARPTAANAKTRPEASTVEYNGKMLSFPREDNFKIIEQAEWQAAWLSDWISGAIGEPVAARAIVALPGWSVKRTSADGISVVNPNQFASLFKHIKPRPLSQETIARIVDQLRQKCRVAAPVCRLQNRGQPAVQSPVFVLPFFH